MKKKSLSAKKKIHKKLLNHLRNKKINYIFKEFERYLDLNVKKNEKIGVAISGGPDSLALAFIAKCYFLKSKMDNKFFIVDHKLRKDSLKEAKYVKNFLKDFDIDCSILKWSGKKPKSNIQGIARNYRYKILRNNCLKFNINNLLIGHHIDDLYENFFIRLIRGSGLKGLSSFGEIIKEKKKNFSILRPLIKFEKKDLIYISKTVFSFFIEDPSNKNLLFTRSRIRKFIYELNKEGFDKKKFNLTINNLRSANNAINFYVEKNIQDNSKYIKKKNTYILNKFFFLQPQEVVIRSISIILNKISHKYYPPRGKSIVDMLKRINLNIFKKLTIGGCCVEKINETMLITREN